MASKLIRLGTKKTSSEVTNKNEDIIYSDIAMVAKESIRDYYKAQVQDDYIGYFVDEQTGDHLLDSSNNVLKIQFSYNLNADTERKNELIKRRQMKIIDKNINIKAIQDSIDNIFSWVPGERILNPEFGSRLNEYLYEGITPMNQELIVAEIKSALSKWDSRINVINVSSVETLENTENNTIELDIEYNIQGLPDEIFHKQYLYNNND